MLQSTVHALLVCVLTSGCASAPRPKLTIHDGPRGTVHLEQIPDTSFQATHPIMLEPDTVARVLRGIQVRDDRTTLQAFLASRPESVRAFSDEDAEFLAPFISSALAKASPDQRIGFRITQVIPPPESKIGGPGPPEPSQSPAPGEITSGILFAYGHSLQIHLMQFRSGSQKRSMIDGPNRHYADQTGLTGRKLEFLPDQAQRPATFRVGETEFPTLVIDYELLARLPDQPAAPVAAPPAAASPVQPATQPAATAQEVEELKKELQEIKKQLNEQQSRKSGTKQKSKPAPAP
jgi:hypothetical protein